MLLKILWTLMMLGISVGTAWFAVAIWIGAHVADLGR